MGERKDWTATSTAMALIAVFCATGWGVERAAGQARGVVIQIPDDVAPGSQRPAAPPPVPAAPAPGSSASAAVVAQGRDLWHVLNTANRTCLVLSKEDLKGSRDVRKLSALLPSPQFVVAAGSCP